MTREVKRRALENMIKEAECMCFEMRHMIQKLHIAFDELPRNKELSN